LREEDADAVFACDAFRGERNGETPGYLVQPLERMAIEAAVWALVDQRLPSQTEVSVAVGSDRR
jgi:hypothetical protein